MPRTRITRHVDRTPEQVFDVVATHVYENHPKWEAEVVEVRPITPGPLRQGSQSVMVREERGRRTETTNVVTNFEPGQLIAFRHDSDALDFSLRFELAKASAGGTDLTVDVNVTPHGLLRLASPLMAIGLPRRTRRITDSMVALIEGRGAQTPTVSVESAATA